jgi:hypothetical protein
MQRRVLFAALTLSATLVLGADASLASGPAPASAPVVGVVGKGSARVLRPLDPRTLQPLRGSWSQRVGRGARLIRSPLGTRVAVSSAQGAAIVVDSRTGRIVARSEEGIHDAGGDLYWFGGERRGRGGAVVLYGFQDAGSFGSWYQFYDLVASAEDGASDAPWAVLPHALVITSLDNEFGRVLGMGPFGFDQDFIGWKKIPVSGQTVWEYPAVADVLHDRIFLISKDGTVAEVNDVSATPRISYHHVDLNGRDFRAAWAGQGRIVLSGADGLGTIDTRTWTTQAISSEGDSVLHTTPYGIIVYTFGRPGVRVYSPDGTLKFTVLQDQVLREPEKAGRPVAGWIAPVVLGRYLYIFANRRVAVDLSAGAVVGPVRADADLALPSYVPIP